MTDIYKIRQDLIERILKYDSDTILTARTHFDPTSCCLQDLTRYQLECVLNKLRADWREKRRKLVKRGNVQDPHDFSILDRAERLHFTGS